jgi:hypothetical protein
MGTAEATINAIQFREARVVGQSNRPSPSPQSLRNFLRQLNKGAERWSEHPLAREPQKNLRQLAAALRQVSPLKPPTPKRKHGGGPKPKLTADEVARLQAAYWADPPRRGKRKQSDVFTALRKLLPKDKRDIGDSTLRSHIVRPRRT